MNPQTKLPLELFAARELVAVVGSLARLRRAAVAALLPSLVRSAPADPGERP